MIDLETHQAVFTWVLQRLADATLVVGRTVGIDATTLEANAAMRSIVRRDTGESYDAFLTRLAEASGLSTPTRAELARFDRTRKTEELERGLDPSARSGREDHENEGRPHASGAQRRSIRSTWKPCAIVGVTVQDASAGDTDDHWSTRSSRPPSRSRRSARRGSAADCRLTRDITATRRWSGLRPSACAATSRSRIAAGATEKGQAAARDAVYANRRRIRGARGKRLLRQRGELVERPNAHLYETGRMRRDPSCAGIPTS